MKTEEADLMCNCATKQNEIVNEIDNEVDNEVDNKIYMYSSIIFLHKKVSEMSVHLNNINTLEYFGYEILDTDRHLIDHYYSVKNGEIVNLLCKHDLKFLKKNSIIPIYKLTLLVVCLLALYHLPALNLRHLLPIYLIRAKDLLDQIIALSKHTKLTFTNYYYIDLTNVLCSYLLPHIH
ncbi:hypothetical protein K502DRAFT_324610 [Neoconidiobolus thromboides FSU 785]|nr:hypothetical protein K502DRAFT_324610 [Neoconidiobolus thromboides FSU 785]